VSLAAHANGLVALLVEALPELTATLLVGHGVDPHKQTVENTAVEVVVLGSAGGLVPPVDDVVRNPDNILPRSECQTEPVGCEELGSPAVHADVGSGEEKLHTAVGLLRDHGSVDVLAVLRQESQCWESRGRSNHEVRRSWRGTQLSSLHPALVGFHQPLSALEPHGLGKGMVGHVVATQDLIATNVGIREDFGKVGCQDLAKHLSPVRPRDAIPKEEEGVDIGYPACLVSGSEG
jgi:hypothetical protein